MSHTPGPWYWKDKAAGIIGSKSESYIAECDHDADAVLIMAAPDLLEALEGMLNEWGCIDECNKWGQPSQRHRPWCQKVQAAIAKARGEA